MDTYFRSPPKNWIESRGNPRDFYQSPRETKYPSIDPHLLAEVAKMHTWQRHRMMVNDTRFLFQRSDILKAAVVQKADYSVGMAWKPQYTGSDPDYKRIAEPVVEDWMLASNARSRAFPFRTMLHIGSQSIDREGDFFLIPRRARSGFPLLEARDGTQCGNRNHKQFVEGGRFDGARIENGVVYNDRRTRPIAYQFLGESAEQDVIVPARNVIHCYDPLYFSQDRGIPSIAYGVGRWYSKLKILDAEESAVLVNAKLALLDSNQNRRDQTEAARVLGTATGATDGRPPKVQMLDDGLIAYVRSQGELKAHENKRPSATWEGFMDYLTRAGITGMGWSYELVWNMKELRGPGARAIGETAQRAIEHRQDRLLPAASSALLHGVQGLTEMGQIPFVGDWFKWSFTLPPKWSIDIGRDKDAELESWKAGHENDRGILSRNGMNHDEHFRERARDWKRKREIAEEEGVPMSIMEQRTPNGNAPSEIQ